VISVRPATAADADRLLDWANDQVTRATGFYPATIDAATHVRWLDERLSSPASRLYIGLEDGRPVGMVRLGAEADGRVEVGISVAPDSRGRGVGRAMLEAGLSAGLADPDLDVAVFVARIRPENAASIALFGSAGFEPTGTDTVAGTPCLVYERAAG
jgi:RimJ/RimL family protein N-acetyltransferase